MAVHLVIFGAALAASVATPGTDTLFLFGRSLAEGPRAAVPYATGILLAKLALLTVAVAGVATAVAAYGSAFLILKLAGGGYLVYLALRRWKRAGHDVDVGARGGSTAWRELATGFFLGASNTQAILFYAAVVPQVINRQPSLDEYLGLSFTLTAVFAVVASGYVLLAGRLKARLASGKSRRRLDRLAAGLTAATGVLVAVR